MAGAQQETAEAESWAKSKFRRKRDTLGDSVTPETIGSVTLGKSVQKGDLLPTVLTSSAQARLQRFAETPSLVATTKASPSLNKFLKQTELQAAGNIWNSRDGYLAGLRSQMGR